MKRSIITLGFLCFLGGMIVAQQPTKTREEQLLEQVATLQLQLAQTTDRWAKCEANGPQSAQFQQAGQTTAQALMKSLADRHLTLDKDGKVVPLQSEAAK
jgi:hypothetical protein